MDLLQITIVIVLALLTLTFVAMGIQFVLILVGIKKLVEKANIVMDDVTKVSNAISNPVANAAGLVSGFTEGLKSVKSLKNLFNKEDY